MSARRLGAPALTLAIGLQARSAEAGGIAEVALRDADRVGVALATGVTASPRTTAVDGRAAIPALGTALRIGPRLVLTADAAIAFTSLRVAGEERGEGARAANPLLGVRVLAWRAPGVAEERVVPDRDRVRLEVGGFIGAPLVTEPGTITRNASAEQADLGASAVFGQRAYAMWARNVVPVFARVNARARIGERLALRLDLEPGVLVSVNRDASYLALVGSLEAGVHVGTSFLPALRVTQLISGRELDSHDAAQTTLAALVRWDGLGHLFGSCEGVLGLDGPQGIVRRYATVWGATLSVGARF